MSQKFLSNEELEKLRFENEFLKAKISAEYGSLLSGASSDTPPQIENAFLNDVILFEETMKNANEILIYDFIGRPVFVKEQDLSDQQLSVELDRLNGLLFDKAIAYVNSNEVEDRLLYKFVTEELFQQTIKDKSIPGMVCHFIYEEFHPNHEQDTRDRCEEFLNAFFDDKFNMPKLDFSKDNIRNFDGLCEFRDLFCEFRNVNVEVLPSEVTPNECIRKASVSFDAITSPGTIPIHYEGAAIFELEYQYEWWVVISAMLPGMEKN